MWWNKHQSGIQNSLIFKRGIYKNKLLKKSSGNWNCYLNEDDINLSNNDSAEFAIP